MAFLLHLCIPLTKPFTWYHNFNIVTVTLKFDLLLKSLTLTITFKPEEVGLSYCTCVFLVTIPVHSTIFFYLDLEV